jgi:putative glutamine amidotransferase
MQRPPVIGITPSFQEANGNDPSWDRWVLSTTYVDAILTAGGNPVIIPPGINDVAPLVDPLDGLLLSGGGDIEPRRFGDATVHPTTYGVLPVRDNLELGLVAFALERDMPVLGICRGIQLLNVAFGGTLVQDIADEWPQPLQHQQHRLGRGRDDVAHSVEILAGSRVAMMYGAGTLDFNSFHHQAIRDPGHGIQVVAKAPDGIVEGIEAPEYSFVVGVQWHPEMLFQRFSQHTAPFQALVEAAQSYAGRRQASATAS